MRVAAVIFTVALLATASQATQINRTSIKDSTIMRSTVSCTVQFPAFTELPRAGFNLTVAPAVSSDWDEATVNGGNAPASTDALDVYSILALTNPPLLNVTNACQLADDDGQFSIYLGAEFGSYEIWSKDSGNPAVLHIFYG